MKETFASKLFTPDPEEETVTAGLGDTAAHEVSGIVIDLSPHNILRQEESSELLANQSDLSRHGALQRLADDFTDLKNQRVNLSSK